jgi:sugar phosphate isomerase/epimerase
MPSIEPKDGIGSWKLWEQICCRFVVRSSSCARLINKQIGSSDAPVISSLDELAADLAELADIMAPKGFRIAYENWCWATHAPDWKDVWAIVKKANRPNLGLCLDAFQSAGGEWADPRTESGLIEDAPKEDIEKRWHQSCQDLANTIPADKVFFLQISDAYKMSPPIPDKADESGLRTRGQRSHDYRPLPYDGEYLPVVDFAKAILGTGFRGWFSTEVFDGKDPAKYDDMGPHAKKAMKCLQRLLDEASA